MDTIIILPPLIIIYNILQIFILIIFFSRKNLYVFIINKILFLLLVFGMIFRIILRTEILIEIYIFLIIVYFSFTVLMSRKKIELKKILFESIFYGDVLFVTLAYYILKYT